MKWIISLVIFLLLVLSFNIYRACEYRSSVIDTAIKPDCVSSSTCVAMAGRKLGYQVRIICKEYEPYMNHAQAQIFIDGKWRWVRMKNNPFDYIEEFPEKKIIQTWELEAFFDNFLRHTDK